MYKKLLQEKKMEHQSATDKKMLNSYISGARITRK
jgi:hypothetical protein